MDFTDRTRPRSEAQAADKPMVGKQVLDPRVGQFAIAIAIPAFRAEATIGAVLDDIPDAVRHVVVVDDASPDQTGAIVARRAETDPRITLIRHQRNLGVGGAMVTAFRKCLELNAQLIVKIDADGQMDMAHLPALLRPLIEGRADYTKGNRFHDGRALRSMPALRRVGNMVLSFLAKAATGYWHSFDPTNGYLAIRREVLTELPLDRIDQSYFFEQSMLSRLYLLGAVVKDVPMPARYGNETSNLSMRNVLTRFPGRLVTTLLRRVLLKNFLYDFTMESVYLMAGVPFVLCGGIYGAANWFAYHSAGVNAPTGTVVIPSVLIILGFQMLLQAVDIDMKSTPREPLCQPLRSDQESTRPAT